MTDSVTGDDQHGSTSLVGAEPVEPVSRMTAVGLALGLVSCIALGLVLGNGVSNMSGWAWALVGALVLGAAWLVSYSLQSTPRSVRITARVQPVAAKVGTGAMVAWLMVVLACGYVVVILAPYSPGLRTWEIGRWVVVQIAFIILLIIITFHLLYPLIETNRRAKLVWRFTQGRATAKSVFALSFGLIVSTSIALWDQLLLLVARSDGTVFDRATTNAGSAAPGEPVSITHLINHNDIFLLLVWQLGDMVPALDVNDTIGFERPLYYSSPIAGWLILGFKAIVGLTLLGIVAAVIQAQRAAPAEPADVSLLPRATRQLLGWRPRWLRPPVVAALDD